MHDDEVKSFESRWKIALLASVAILLQQPAVAQTVNYTRDASTVVVSYRIDIGEIADTESGPSVQIFGDGNALVHVPRYRRDSGDFKTKLSQAEMDNLMATLVANGVLDFDAAAAKQAIRNARQQRGGGAAEVLTESTDPDVTTIELRVRRNAAPGAGSGGGAAEVTKVVRWVGLRRDAQQFGEIAAIRKLAAASERMEAVMERPDLQPVASAQ